jgi:transcriptional regulator with XRE-family HTH domain
MAARDVKLLFGQRVRQLRKEKGLSQEGFAHSIDMDRSYYGSVERGERNVSLENIFVIADGLGVPAAELLRFEGLDDPGTRAGATTANPAGGRKGRKGRKKGAAGRKIGDS